VSAVDRAEPHAIKKKKELDQANRVAAEKLRVEEERRAREMELTNEMDPSGAEKRGQSSEHVTRPFDSAFWVLVTRIFWDYGWLTLYTS
jgi:hypothetical protein